MTEKETIQIVTIIVMSYPASDKFKDETTLKGMVAVWKNIFKDDDVRLVEFAVQKHIASNKWPPSIAEIREQMVAIQRPDIIPPDIAWTMVTDVLYAEDEFGHFDLYRTFPPAIARVVETIGWERLYNLHCGRARGNPDGLDRVAFMDLYKPMYEREIQKAMMPQSIRTAYEQKQKELGGKNLQLVEEAHNQRREKEQYWNSLNGIPKRLEQRDKKLLGGSEDDYE